MANNKLAKGQDIPGMKIYDEGSQKARTGWNFMAEAKMKCRKVIITSLGSPEAEMTDGTFEEPYFTL
jgi:hypothetical protein